MEDPEKKDATKAPELIEENEAEQFNRKTAMVAHCFFKAMTELTADELYAMAFTDAGKNSPRLLEVINMAYADMLASGGEVPKLYFDNYKKIVSDFCNTIVFNIEEKFKDNEKFLIAQAVGKTESADKISYKDIIDALSK